jgi:hypothetical protein
MYMYKRTFNKSTINIKSQQLSIYKSIVAFKAIEFTSDENLHYI